METKKALWFIVFLLCLILYGCNSVLQLEEPLKFRERIPKEEQFTLRAFEENSTLKGNFFTVNQTSLSESSSELELKPILLPNYKDKLLSEEAPPPEIKEERMPINYSALVGVREPVKLNVEGMPLNEFIIYSLGELLKVPFLVDDNVMKNTTPVNLRLPRPLAPEEILEAVISYLERLNFEVYQKGRVLYIGAPKPRPAPPPRMQNYFIGDLSEESSKVVTLFYVPKYLNHHELDLVLREYQFLKPFNVNVRVYPPAKALMLVGPANQIKRVLEILEFLDVPFFKGKKVYSYKPTFIRVEDLKNELTSILNIFGYPVVNNLKDPGILLIPLRSQNMLLMAFPDEESQKFTLDWIAKLDTAQAVGEQKRIYTYKPKYAKAAELAEALSKVYAIYTTTQSPFSAVQTPSPQPLASIPQTTTPQQPQRMQASQPARGFFATSDKLNIYADERRNLLIISTTAPLYKEILQLLRELDQPPKQILIEATILELSLQDELKLGLEWFIKNRFTGGNYTLQQMLGIPSTLGLTYTMITDTQTFSMLIRAFASRGLTNILSTPRLLVLDNHGATIQVGQDVPVITGEVTSTQAVIGQQTGVVRSIQYRNTGIILHVKPTTYTENLLQLEITQEVSSMGASPPGLDSPTISVRKITTTVIAQDGQTILLGGLISNQKGKGESKVPLLGDLPLIGNLFKSTSNEERKTELIVLLRPYILKSIDEAVAFTEEIKEKLKWLKN